MKPIAISLALIAIAFIMILPHDRSAPAPFSHVHSADGQIADGQSAGKETVRQAAVHRIWEHDIEKTDDLCRTQCTADFKRSLSHLKAGMPKRDAQRILGHLRRSHPQMEQLLWSDLALPQAQAAVSGKAPENSEPMIRSYYKAAGQSADRGDIYQSPPIRIGQSAYFVLGVPSSDQSHALIGLIHQEILDDVAAHQKRNLRMVPYPGEGRFNMKSVDSETGRDIRVNDGEDNSRASHYHRQQVVVKFKRMPTPAQLDAMKKELGSSIPKRLDHTFVFDSDRLTTEQLMQYFKHRDIEYVEPHYYYMTNVSTNAAPAPVTAPNDALYAKYQWNLPIMGTELGWELSRGSANVQVAVVDTGVDFNHPDLQGHLLDGINVIDQSSAPRDDVGHGTHVAGIIAALVDNAEGVAGITWYNPILPVKVLDETGAGNTYSVAQGIIWATDHGARVINMSLGNYADAQFLHDAIKYAFDRDVVIVAASGNDNTERPGFPAAYPEVFAVAAMDGNRAKASFSNYGDYIDAAAPGVNIASTYLQGQYAAMSGTSMASPHAAALAALIRSINPQLTNTEVMDIMRQTAIDLGPKGKDPYFGYGQIDVAAALQRANPVRASNQNQKKIPAKSWLDWIQRLLHS